MTILGVLADTHIPDRAAVLDRQVIQSFKQANVSAILHAGDVSVPRVLKELVGIAPVYAVRGNRDIFALRKLPMEMQINIDGFSIGLTHGHGTFSRYMIDKLHRQVQGRLVERYLRRVLQTFPQADVIVFGHLHVPCNMQILGKLIINPGSTSYPCPRSEPATFGLLHLEQGMAPRAEIIEIRK